MRTNKLNLEQVYTFPPYAKRPFLVIIALLSGCAENHLNRWYCINYKKLHTQGESSVLTLEFLGQEAFQNVLSLPISVGAGGRTERKRDPSEKAIFKRINPKKYREHKASQYVPKAKRECLNRAVLNSFPNFLKSLLQLNSSPGQEVGSTKIPSQPLHPTYRVNRKLNPALTGVTLPYLTSH